VIRSIKSGSFGEPWVIVKWQLAAGDGLLEFGLLISYMVRGWKPFLPFGYPGVDIFRRVQGYVGSLDDDGLSRNRLGLVAVKERGWRIACDMGNTCPLSDGSASQSRCLCLLWSGGYIRCLSIICISTAF